MAIRKELPQSNKGRENEGAEGAVDPGPAPIGATVPGAPLNVNESKDIKDHRAEIQAYREVTGDPTGAARNSAEAGALASAEAVTPGSVAPNNAVLDAQEKAADEARAQALKDSGAKVEKPKKRAAQQLKAVNYPIRDPFTGVLVSMEGTVEKVEVTNWMQAQINAGLVVIIGTEKE